MSVSPLCLRQTIVLLAKVLRQFTLHLTKHSLSAVTNRAGTLMMMMIVSDDDGDDDTK